MSNFFLIVLDGVGVGELPDASVYKDEGSNTLANIAKAVGGLSLQNLEKMGLGNIVDINGIQKVNNPVASFGKMKEISKGKDSTTGHWEIGGLFVDTDFSYFPDGFPEEIVNSFIKKAQLEGILGNKAASGTEIIKNSAMNISKQVFPLFIHLLIQFFRLPRTRMFLD
jgi:phosphopentomutase